MTLGKEPTAWREHILALGLSWLYQWFFLVSRMMIPIDWVNQEVTKAWPQAALKPRPAAFRKTTSNEDRWGKDPGLPWQDPLGPLWVPFGTPLGPLWTLNFSKLWIAIGSCYCSLRKAMVKTGPWISWGVKFGQQDWASEFSEPVRSIWAATSLQGFAKRGGDVDDQPKKSHRCDRCCRFIKIPKKADEKFGFTWVNSRFHWTWFLRSRKDWTQDYVGHQVEGLGQDRPRLRDQETSKRRDIQRILKFLLVISGWSYLHCFDAEHCRTLLCNIRLHQTKAHREFNCYNCNDARACLLHRCTWAYWEGSDWDRCVWCTSFLIVFSHRFPHIFPLRWPNGLNLGYTFGKNIFTQSQGFSVAHVSSPMGVDGTDWDRPTTFIPTWQVLSTLHTGDSFGELSLLYNIRREARTEMAWIFLWTEFSMSMSGG